MVEEAEVVQAWCPVEEEDLLTKKVEEVAVVLM
jgi:hypothetical protein